MNQQENTSFSQQSPGMQVALDSTSLTLAKECARKYQLSMVEGWDTRREKVDLVFGIWLHEARQRYEMLRAQGPGGLFGLDHEEALDRVLSWALCATWNRELGRPWLSDNPVKNRKTLIQTIVWYLDDKAREDPLETIIGAEGKPQVELSFRFDSGLKTRKGETILLCGHLDRVAQMNGTRYVPDIKTTKSVPDARWFAQFSPHNQFTLYTFAGRVAFGEKIEGVIVDGVQVGVEFSRFQRYLVPRDEAQIEEWYRGLKELVAQMEHWAGEGFWPMNETACDKFGGCQFRPICSRSPGSRQRFLEAEFVKRIWDPLQVRGEL